MAWVKPASWRCQDAQRRWYRLRAEPLTEIDEWLTPYRRFWEDRLDALERARLP